MLGAGLVSSVSAGLSDGAEVAGVSAGVGTASRAVAAGMRLVSGVSGSLDSVAGVVAVSAASVLSCAEEGIGVVVVAGWVVVAAGRAGAGVAAGRLLDARGEAVPVEARTCAFGIVSAGPAQPVTRWPAADSRAVKGSFCPDIESVHSAA